MPSDSTSEGPGNVKSFHRTSKASAKPRSAIAYAGTRTDRRIAGPDLRSSNRQSRTVAGFAYRHQPTAILVFPERSTYARAQASSFRA